MFDQLRNMIDSARARVSGMRPNLMGGQLSQALGGQVGRGQAVQRIQQMVGNAQSKARGIVGSRPKPLQQAASALGSNDGLLATNFSQTASGFRAEPETPTKEIGAGYRFTK